MSDVQYVHMMREDLSGARARTDSRTNYGQPAKSPPDTEDSSDLPESKGDNDTPVSRSRSHQEQHEIRNATNEANE